MGNGAVERFNQTLLKMLGTLEEYAKSDWKTYVAPLVHAYNATTHESTGFSPHYLMFGWHPRLAIDAYLGVDNVTDESGSRETYTKKLKKRLDYAYKVAADEARKQSTRHKAIYDTSVRESTLDVGDRVLVRNVGIRGKHKLADRWEKDPYIVQRIPNPDVPVYEVQKESVRGPVRTLHRNLLLPFTSIPCDTTELHTDSTPMTKPKTRCTPKFTDTETTSCTSSDDTDTDTTQRYIIPARRKLRYLPEGRGLLKSPEPASDSSRISTNGQSITDTDIGDTTRVSTPSADVDIVSRGGPAPVTPGESRETTSRVSITVPPEVYRETARRVSSPVTPEVVGDTRRLSMTVPDNRTQPVNSTDCVSVNIPVELRRPVRQRRPPDPIWGNGFCPILCQWMRRTLYMSSYQLCLVENVTGRCTPYTNVYDYIM